MGTSGRSGGLVRSVRALSRCHFVSSDKRALFLVLRGSLTGVYALLSGGSIWGRAHPVFGFLSCLQLDIIRMPEWCILRWHILNTFGVCLGVKFLVNTANFWRNCYFPKWPLHFTFPAGWSLYFLTFMMSFWSYSFCSYEVLSYFVFYLISPDVDLFPPHAYWITVCAPLEKCLFRPFTHFKIRFSCY